MELLTSKPSASKKPNVLLTDANVSAVQIVESKTEEGPTKVIVRGEFARCGKATENKRVYPAKLWEREINRLRKSMDERQVYCECDHPTDGKTKLQRACGLLTNLWIENDVVMGETEILDTQNGKDLKAILSQSGRVGVSSRGYGSVRQDEHGQDVVQDDYRLVTFDFVVDPANATSFPEVFYEDKEADMAGDQDLALEFAAKLDSARDEARRDTESSLREEFAKDLVAQMAKLKAEIRESVRRELLTDPEVAASKVALDQIKSILRPYVLPEDVRTVTESKDTDITKLNNSLAEMKLRQQDLENENERLADIAKTAGYKYYLESALSGDPDKSLITKIVGDVRIYPKAADLKLKVESVRTELSNKRAAAQRLEEENQIKLEAEEARRTEERRRVVKREKALKEENEKLRSALDKSLTANNLLAVRTYAESRLANHPQASKIRQIIESSNVASKKDVDGILEQFRAPRLDADEADSVRARVRAKVGHGFSPTPLEEEAPSAPRANGPYSELGASLGDLRRLAGMGQDNLPPAHRAGPRPQR